MKNTKEKTMRITNATQRAALASPLRLEILGLFTIPEPLAIADMAGLMGRSAGSLYHHVGLLEKAGLLLRTGTRPKGKRHEALFRPAADRLEYEADPNDQDLVQNAVKAMASAFRMVERDLAAAMVSDTSKTEGPERNVFATRIHMRVQPKTLVKVNKHLRAIEDLLLKESVTAKAPKDGDQHLSLTLALLPLKGRDQFKTPKGE